MDNQIQEKRTNIIEDSKPTVFKRVFCFILLLILLPAIIIFFIIKSAVKSAKKRKWEKEGLRGKLLLLEADISDIDIMEGYEFENYLKTLFFYEGYVTEVTTQSRDYGADLVMQKDGRKIIVQAKRYTKNVGAKSVQEILGATKHYNATEAFVVTNSHFTYAAETIAKENQIRLIDREELIEIYTRVKQQLKISTRESELVNKKDSRIEDRFPFMI